MSEREQKAILNLLISVEEEDGKEKGADREFSITVPIWICGLAKKLIAPNTHNEITKTITPLGDSAVFVDIGGWDERFFVYLSENGSFVVELPVEGEKRAKNLDEVVDLIRQHIKRWAQIRFERAFS